MEERSAGKINGEDGWIGERTQEKVNEENRVWGGDRGREDRRQERKDER